MGLSHMSSHHQQIKPVSVFRSHNHLSLNTYKEPHLAKIATHNWRQNATSKCKTSQMSSDSSKDWHRDNQRVGMPGHHCLPECLGPVNATRCCAMRTVPTCISSTPPETPIGSRTCRKIFTMLPGRSCRFYTTRARNHFKCEAPRNKAIGSAVTKHHLAPSTTPTLVHQKMCDPLVEDLTAPCMCALFLFLTSAATQKKKKRRDETSVLFVTTHERSTRKKKR